MKTKIFNGSKRTALAIAVLMFTLSIIGGLASIFSTKAFAVGEKVNLLYNPSEMSYTHGATYVHDTGKSGIQFSTVKTGDAAEGSTFSFADTMTGTFDIDFRVESEKTYVQPVTSGWSHYISAGKADYSLSDYNNPYADLQELAIKFTSATNPDKYFIVYVMGSAADVAFATTASVYVNGDTLWEYSYNNGAKVQTQHGYGLDMSSHALNYAGSLESGAPNTVAGYKMFTAVRGTSFSNYTSYSSDSAANPYYDDKISPTTSNLVKFDPSTMQVYVNAGKNTKYYGSINLYSDVLVRNIATNEGYTYAGTGTAPTVATISPEDFANGYSVSVEFTKVTSNSEVGNSSYFGGVTQYKTIATAYDRTPKMTIYSVNGTALTEENVNVDLYENISTREPIEYIDYNSSDFEVTENYINDLDAKSGLRIQSKQSGNVVDGKSFSLVDEMAGVFDVDFRVQSKNDYAHVQEGAWTHQVGDWSGLIPRYMFSDNMNPYNDLQEVGFKFASKTDPDKYFIVYILGTAGHSAFLTSSYVYVNGDKTNAMVDENGEFVQGYGYGYSYSWSNDAGAYVASDPYYNASSNIDELENYAQNNGVGGLTVILGTTFSNFITTSSGKIAEGKTTSNMIKFDPATMNVYVNAGHSHSGDYAKLNTTADILVRDIANNAYYTSAVEGSSVASIQPEDFANGYTVDVIFSDVTDNATVGDSSKFGGITQYPTLIETPYERYVDMTIYSLNGRDLGTSSVADDGKPVVTSPVAKMEKGVEVDLAPLFYDTIGGNTVGVYGTVEVSYNGGEFTTIANNGNKYLYTPTEIGTYTVKYSGFKDEQGNAIVDTTSTISCYVAQILTYGVDKTAKFEKGTKVNLSNYVTEVQGKKFVGWKINGELYTADYVITMDSDITVEPVYLGFAMENGAYIRIVVGENAGIRFMAKVDVADLNALIALVGEEKLTFVYGMTANNIPQTRTKSYQDFLTITEEVEDNYLTAVAITNVGVDKADVEWTGEIALKITYVNGESTISAGSLTRSIKAVANAVYNKAETYNALSEKEQDIVKLYAGIEG